MDEIQEICDWQIAIKDLRLDNNSIFITGSNSKLLSSEILTLLSGRFVSFRIRPFVYSEIEEYMSQMKKACPVNDYLIWGGFPGRFLYDSIESQKDYLSDLENTIVYNDLIKRYKIKKEVAFKKKYNSFGAAIQESSLHAAYTNTYPTNVKVFLSIPYSNTSNI